VNVVDYYGLTETAGLCTAATGDQQGIGTARRALVHLVDPQGHSIRGPGHGELRVFSAGRFTRYLGDRQATARRLSGGWVCTGDHARRDHNGHLHLLGRTDRLLCAPSGENLHPEEVERALLGAPGVSGVAVVQVADRHGIARIWAVVEGEGQARALLDRVRERLGRRAVPDRLVFRKLPRSASGKMDLAALRASLAEAE
jgi:acyl-coenzyme A synthetase/AMP-(fatty) acid ligase